MGGLVDVDVRLRRAARQLKKIKKMLRAYYKSRPYETRGQYDADKRELRVRLTAQAPDVETDALVGEYLHNLRSALDHLAWQLVLEHGGTPGKRSTFPILATPPGPDNRGTEPPLAIEGGVSAAAMALIEASQPYTFGTNYHVHELWRLDRLAAIDRRRNVVIRGSIVNNFWLGPAGPRPTPSFGWTTEVIEMSEWGTELVLRSDDPTVEVQGRASLRVIVDEPGPEDLLVEVPLFNALADADLRVRQIVGEAERTCFWNR